MLLFLCCRFTILHMCTFGFYVHLFFRHIHLSSPEKNSIASFMLSENPVAMDITACEDEVKVDVFSCF